MLKLDCTQAAFDKFRGPELAPGAEVGISADNDHDFCYLSVLA